MRSSWATERASSLWNRLSDQTGKRGPHSAAQAVGPKNVQNRENTAMRGCVNFPKTLSYILSLQFRTNSLNLIPQSLRSHMVNALPRRDWKQLKGCVFSPPSLFPVPARGMEARKRNLSIASHPISLLHCPCTNFPATDYRRLLLLRAPFLSTTQSPAPVPSSFHTAVALSLCSSTKDVGRENEGATASPACQCQSSQPD